MLGKRLSKLLQQLGHKVITCSRDISSDIQLDLRSGFTRGIPSEISADAVYHCAAAFGDDSPEGCRLNDMVNAHSCYWVIEMCRSVDSRHLVYAGTSSSYVDPETGYISSYGFSKARAEDILQWGLSRLGIGFVSLRFPQLYDENGECCRHQPWFGRIIAYASSGKLLRMPRSNGTRNFIHVDDAALMMQAALENRVMGRLGLSHPESLSYKDIAAKAYEIFASNGDFIEVPEKTPFRKVYFPDSTESFAKLNCRPSINMSDGINMIKRAGTANKYGPIDVS
jgi:nucleoside-diphosphate-sugar epimerase